MRIKFVQSMIVCGAIKEREKKFYISFSFTLRDIYTIQQMCSATTMKIYN